MGITNLVEIHTREELYQWYLNKVTFGGEPSERENMEFIERNCHEDGNDYLPFLKYMLGIVVKAYNEFEDRVERLRYRKVSKPERIKAIIERTLADLLSDGYIEKTGSGRATAYVKK